MFLPHMLLCFLLLHDKYGFINEVYYFILVGNQLSAVSSMRGFSRYSTYNDKLSSVLYMIHVSECMLQAVFLEMERSVPP